MWSAKGSFSSSSSSSESAAGALAGVGDRSWAEGFDLADGLGGAAGRGGGAGRGGFCGGEEVRMLRPAISDSGAKLGLVGEAGFLPFASITGICG